MDDTNSLIEQRKAKLAALRAKGIDPFKNKFTPGETCQHAREHYAEGREVALAGRITAHRDMGKSIFLDIRDQSGRMQIYAQKNVLGDEQFAIFQHLDLADFIGVKGTQFTTKTNEISVKITGFTILAKALRPPPAKWHGLEDTEIRYRQRYLDLMASKAAAPGTSTTGFEKGSPGDVLLLRSEIIREIRNFLHALGFVEVETPMMQAIPGGAAAQPFITKHNALGCNFYLRIALELPLKRMLVGGVDKVFEIGRVFRNEGLSRKHNPEFTMLEAYEAYGDYESMMELVQSMICHVAQKVLGTLSIKRPCQKNVKAIIDELIRRLEELSKEAVNVSTDSRTRQFVANEIRKNVDPLLAQLDEIRKKINAETPFEEMRSQVSPLVVKAGMELVVQMTSAEEVDLPDAKNEQAVQDFEAGWKRNMNKVWVFIHFGLQRLIAELENPTIELDKWDKRKYRDLVRERIREKTNCKISDWFALTPEERRHVAVHDLKLRDEIPKDYEDFEVTGAVFEKLIEPTLIQPTFVTHLPKELVPLAKLSPDDPTTVEVFECCINGQEIAPAYTEQNDPIEQRERLEHQAGGEQQKLDEDFLIALEHGMPPAGGMGMGIDRLCMMLLGQESIRDVILFPQLKPK
jgi:lysyl-tRNA synthetase class 2